MKNIFNLLKNYAVPKKTVHQFKTFQEALESYGTDDSTLQKSYRNFCYMAYLWGACFIGGSVYFLLNLILNFRFEAAAFFFVCISFSSWFKGAAYAYSLKYQTLNIKPLIRSPGDYFPEWGFKIQMNYAKDSTVVSMRR